jgi:hypothetical protein
MVIRFSDYVNSFMHTPQLTHQNETEALKMVGLEFVKS